MSAPGVLPRTRRKQPLTPLGGGPSVTSMNTDTTATVRLACDCTVCQGAAITADATILDGATTPKARREVAHTFVAGAVAGSPLAAVMGRRYNVTRVA